MSPRPVARATHRTLPTAYPLGFSAVGRLSLALLTASATFAVARRAEACSCPSETVVTQPSGGNLWRDGKILGFSLFGRLSSVVAYYVDDPSRTPVAGQLEVLGSAGAGSIWSFTPAQPLEVGRTLHVDLEGNGSTLGTHEYVVVADALPGPPNFPGVTAFEAVESTITVTQGDSCSPMNGATQDWVVFPGLPAPSADAPILRYYVYETPGTRPTTPSAVGVEGYHPSVMRCGNAELRCEPRMTLFLSAGQRVCARVEAEDLAGRRSGYDQEVCTTVRGESVGYDPSTGACLRTDAGVQPDLGTSSGADVLVVGPDLGSGGGATDVGTTGDLDAGTQTRADAAVELPRAEDTSGCGCTAGAPAGGLEGLAWLGLLAAGRARRRR